MSSYKYNISTIYHFMGNCLKKSAALELQTASKQSEKHNIQLQKAQGLSRTEFYKEDERQLKLKRSYQIAQPTFYCASKNKIIYVCLDQLCQKDCFHCKEHSCKVCYKRHRVVSASIHLKWLTAALNIRAKAQMQFLQRIDQIQLNVTSKITERNRIVLEQLNLNGLDQIEQKLIRNIYQNNIMTDLSAKSLKRLFDRLEHWNNQLRDFSASLQKQYKESIQQLARRLLQQKKSIYERFSKNLIGSYTLSRQQKQINDFPNLSYPNKKYFSAFMNQEAIKIKHIHPSKQFHCFIFDEAINQKRTATFTLNQYHTYNQNIHIGVATNNIFDRVGVLQTVRNKEAIVYSSMEGKIFEMELQRHGGRRINDGQLIRLQVNTVDWSLNWKAGSQLVGTAKINQFMRNKNSIFCSDDDLGR